MNLLKFLGFGVLIWDVAFITSAVLESFEIFPSMIMQTIFIVIAIVVFLLSENLEISSGKEIFKYGVAWALVMMFLDAMVATCCLGWESFYQYNTWINYAIVVFMPILTVNIDKGSTKK